MSAQRFLLLGLAAAATATTITPRSAKPSCRVLPGDAAWPKAADWAKLNKTINGQLIASVPPASVCHNAPFNNYNAETCAIVQRDYALPKLRFLDSPSGFLNQYFWNYTCDPFTPRDQTCKLGNHVSYVINITKAEDVQDGIKFAKKHNVRLVIKNTGHDYLGKSTGKGGLSLWTHNLKSNKFIPNYDSSYYKGPAIKLGAGNEGFDAYLAANATGHQIVGGSCPTVGIAGGFSQGGGHSMLSSKYGLGADNVLEWEVVTMEGEHLIATPKKNSDLYWAMSGGGGGTYGVAISMTSRLHKDDIVGGASISFNDTKVGNDAFWEAVGSFHTLLGPYLDQGNTFLYVLTNHAFGSWGVTMPGANLDRVNKLLKPFFDDLTKRGIDYEFSARISPNFYSHFNYYLGPLPEGVTGYAPFYASRILPRAMTTNPTRNKIVTSALRNATLAEAFTPICCLGLNVAKNSHPDNAVLPAWRNGLSVCLAPGVWDPTATPAEMQARQDFVANELQPMLDAAMPDSGVYLNEANYKQQNWQRELYGSNYPKLLKIKNKYDPESMLYAHTAVGSETWYEDGEQRLCRA